MEHRQPAVAWTLLAGGRGIFEKKSGRRKRAAPGLVSAGKLGPKTEPNTVDAKHWVHDIGCNSDCSVDDTISSNVRDLVARFRHVANAKASFATKFVNRALLDHDPQGKTRIRFTS